MDKTFNVALALAELTTYIRFKEMAAKGDRAEGLRLLEKLDELSVEQ